ncbi:class I SAM-dependent methyltransferase [Rhodobacteraceae bacterium NNCM2]|nr:class I SAM-dependent methyltransferase [Coraliihabitans acroporae]
MADDKLLGAARRAIALIRETADIPMSVRLWDGSVEPLGTDVPAGRMIRIETPGVLPSLLRRPTLDRAIRHYAHGRIDIEGGSWVDFGAPFALDNSVKRRLRQIPKGKLVMALAPLLLARGDSPDESRGFAGDAEGAARQEGENQKFIQFHYDVGDDFYRLFLDPEMQYSCAYFPEGVETLEEAQVAKLDMICRKLRLKEGESFLDIGCGWGGLVRHAARHYGVKAHGITLSDAQAAEAQARVQRDGLADRVTIQIIDYRNLTGHFDKIASIGMYEHIGLKNIPHYFGKVRSLMALNGLFLNHAISRGAKRRKTRFSKRPEQKALQRYIFPGGELDDIGNTVAEMEKAKLEVHDVEAWRRHYERTTRIWCERLTARRAEAEALVGAQTYRLWSAYLGGCSLAFLRGSARIYQTLASQSPKGIPPLPPSRADLYR